MWIERITLKNFRSYGPQPVEIEPRKGMNILVGENNSGKSSMFAAFEYLIQRRGHPLEDSPYGDISAPLSLILTYRLHPGDKRQAFATFFADGAAVAEDHPGRVKFTDYMEETNFTVDWNGQTSTASIGPYGVQDRAVVIGDDGRDVSFPGFLQRVEQTGSVEKAFLGIRHLNLGQPLPDLFMSMFAARYRVFNDVRARPQGVGGTEDFLSRGSFDGASTADFLMSLKNGGAQQRGRYARIQEHFASFFPNLTFELTARSGSAPQVVFNRREIEFDIPQQNVGTGVLEILTLIANLEGRRGDILIVEEPELHLHPHSQRALLRMLKESSEHNQIFVLTHSPFFIDPGDPESTHRVWMGEDGTNVTPFPTDLPSKDRGSLIEHLRDPGQREMLFSRGVLLVEGDTESAFLSTIGPKTAYDLDAKAVSIISVDGESNYIPYIRLLVAWHIPFLCHRDKGPGGSAPQYADRFRYIGAEFEGYLESQGFGRLLEEARKEVGNNKPRIGRYLGTHIEPENVPEKFLTLLQEAVEMVS